MSRIRGALPLLAVTLLISAAGPSASQAEPSLSFQPQLGVPGLRTLLGFSPGEAPGEVWAAGEIGPVPAIVGGRQVTGQVLLRHSQGSGWQIVPVADGQGNLLSFNGTPKVTYDGGVALLGGEGSHQTIITRDPGGTFRLAPAPAGTLLHPGETLYPTHSGESALFTALDDAAASPVTVLLNWQSAIR